MRLGFVFPGQGSQSIAMLSELSDQFNHVKQTFAEASEILDYDLWQLVQHGPEAEINDTRVTQPAMLAAGFSVWRAWRSLGYGQPDVLAGHSLGEYTALVCAGTLDFKAAVNVVAERGRFMQEAVPVGQGAMAAILGLDDHTVVELCDKAAEGQVVSAVNFNSPGQVVVAGHKEAVTRAVDQAKESGAKRALILPVSVPSHCLLMKPAADRLANLLDTVEMKSPEIPVINNVDVALRERPEDIKEALIKQLYSPVRWVETIREMGRRGVTHVVECGPGKVLAGLNKRITPDLQALPVYDTATLEKARSALEI